MSEEDTLDDEDLDSDSDDSLMSNDDIGPEDDSAEDDTPVNALSDSSITAKEAERARIQAEIEAFLSGGGKITQVGTDVMNDPPQRPQANYGGQPI